MHQRATASSAASWPFYHHLGTSIVAQQPGHLHGLGERGSDSHIQTWSSRLCLGPPSFSTRCHYYITAHIYLTRQPKIQVGKRETSHQTCLFFKFFKHVHQDPDIICFCDHRVSCAINSTFPPWSKSTNITCGRISWASPSPLSTSCSGSRGRVIRRGVQLGKCNPWQPQTNLLWVAGSRESSVHVHGWHKKHAIQSSTGVQISQWFPCCPLGLKFRFRLCTGGGSLACWGGAYKFGIGYSRCCCHTSATSKYMGICNLHVRAWAVCGLSSMHANRSNAL